MNEALRTRVTEVEKENVKLKSSFQSNEGHIKRLYQQKSLMSEEISYLLNLKD